jgi:hypothetical protein
MAMSLDDPHSPKNVGSAATPEPAAPVPVNTVTPPAPPAAPSLPPQIEDFDALINGDVQNFVDLGEKIGGLVAEQVSNSSLRLRSCVRLSDFFDSPRLFFKLSKPSAPTFTSRQRRESPNLSHQSL